MKKIRWIFLGYILALLMNGCDLGISSSEDFESTLDNGLGSSPYNPVYVRIVE